LGQFANRNRQQRAIYKPTYKIRSPNVRLRVAAREARPLRRPAHARRHCCVSMAGDRSPPMIRSLIFAGLYLLASRKARRPRRACPGPASLRGNRRTLHAMAGRGFDGIDAGGCRRAPGRRAARLDLAIAGSAQRHGCRLAPVPGPAEEALAAVSARRWGDSSRDLEVSKPPRSLAAVLAFDHVPRNLRAKR